MPPIKKPHSKAYLSVMVLYGCGRVAADPKLFICRPASELCGGEIGLKSAFYPGSDRFNVDEQHLVPTWISARSEAPLPNSMLGQLLSVAKYR